MNNRFFATLTVVCLALAGGGCASEAQKQKYEDQALLPRQTGSLLSRRMNLEPDQESKPKKKKHDETKQKHDETKPAKKTAKKTEPTEPEKPKEPKPAPAPEETPAEPDRFR